MMDRTLMTCALFLVFSCCTLATIYDYAYDYPQVTNKRAYRINPDCDCCYARPDADCCDRCRPSVNDYSSLYNLFGKRAKPTTESAESSAQSSPVKSSSSSEIVETSKRSLYFQCLCCYARGEYGCCNTCYNDSFYKRFGRSVAAGDMLKRGWHFGRSSHHGVNRDGDCRCCLTTGSEYCCTMCRSN